VCQAKYLRCPTSGHFVQPETENQTPSTKARQTGRAFFIPKTEYETQQPAFARKRQMKWQ
jgi:hypothetical protein